MLVRVVIVEVPKFAPMGDSPRSGCRQPGPRPRGWGGRGARPSTPPGRRRAGAPGHVAPRLQPVTGRRGLLPTPLPAAPWGGLPACLPAVPQERAGRPPFHQGDRDGCGALSAPGAWGGQDRVQARPWTRSGTCVAHAAQPRGLACGHDVSPAFPWVPHSVPPAPSPPEVRRDPVASRLWGQSGAWGSVVRGHWPACARAAVPRRLLRMAPQAWSLLHARQATLRPRVAVLPSPAAFQEHAAHLMRWSMRLSPTSARGPCLPQGLLTFLHAAFTAHRWHAPTTVAPLSSRPNSTWHRVLTSTRAAGPARQRDSSRPPRVRDADAVTRPDAPAGGEVPFFSCFHDRPGAHVQHPRGSTPAAGRQSPIHDLSLDLRRLASVDLLEETRASLIRARPAPIPLLPLPCRAMSHTIRTLPVGTVETLDPHAATRSRWGFSAPPTCDERSRSTSLEHLPVVIASAPPHLN